MPADFDKCVKDGGCVRTKKLSGGKYQHICYIGGKSYAGYVKTAKSGRDGYMEARKKG